MGKAAADPPGGQKMVPADCVSVLLMALGNTTISKAQFEMMSALDGTKTASSFEHQFRSIIAKAKDLKAKVNAGESFEPVQPSKKRSEKAFPVTTQKRKSVATDRDEGSPKKARTTPNPGRKRESTPPEELDDLGDKGFPSDAEDFIKKEQEWEQQFDN